MKAIGQMNNVEKGKLLHQLFPSEIPAFLQYVQRMCTTIKEEEQQQREQWNNGLFGFDFWLSLIGDAEQKINRYGSKLHHNSGLFADQLFDGYLAMYIVHCLMVYTTVRKHPNGKFTMTIDLLFNDTPQQ
jgi:hypothetical protein